jgi:hypothetical protein
VEAGIGLIGAFYTLSMASIVRSASPATPLELPVDLFPRHANRALAVERFEPVVQLLLLRRAHRNISVGKAVPELLDQSESLVRRELLDLQSRFGHFASLPDCRSSRQRVPLVGFRNSPRISSLGPVADRGLIVGLIVDMILGMGVPVTVHVNLMR